MSHTPPVDSKGAAIRAEITKIILTRGMPKLPDNIMVTDMSIETVKAVDAILAILAQEVKRVIGKDEPRLHHDIDPEYDHEEEVDKEARNELRAEQRRKAGLV